MKLLILLITSALLGCSLASPLERQELVDEVLEALAQESNKRELADIESNQLVDAESDDELADMEDDDEELEDEANEQDLDSVLEALAQMTGLEDEELADVESNDQLVEELEALEQETSRESLADAEDDDANVENDDAETEDDGMEEVDAVEQGGLVRPARRPVVVRPPQPGRPVVVVHRTRPVRPVRPVHPVRRVVVHPALRRALLRARVKYGPLLRRLQRRLRRRPVTIEEDGMSEQEALAQDDDTMETEKQLAQEEDYGTAVAESDAEAQRIFKGRLLRRLVKRIRGKLSAMFIRIRDAIARAFLNMGPRAVAESNEIAEAERRGRSSRLQKAKKIVTILLRYYKYLQCIMKYEEVAEVQGVASVAICVAKRLG